MCQGAMQLPPVGTFFSALQSLGTFFPFDKFKKILQMNPNSKIKISEYAFSCFQIDFQEIFIVWTLELFLVSWHHRNCGELSTSPRHVLAVWDIVTAFIDHWSLGYIGNSMALTGCRLPFFFRIKGFKIKESKESKKLLSFFSLSNTREETPPSRRARQHP